MNTKTHFIYNQSLDGIWDLYIAENKNVFANDNEIQNVAAISQLNCTCIKGSVPGNFELDLERDGLIKEIFLGTNSLGLQELENRHLWYARTF